MTTCTEQASKNGYPRHNRSLTGFQRRSRGWGWWGPSSRPQSGPPGQSPSAWPPPPSWRGSPWPRRCRWPPADAKATRSEAGLGAAHKNCTAGFWVKERTPAPVSAHRPMRLRDALTYMADIFSGLRGDEPAANIPPKSGIILKQLEADRGTLRHRQNTPPCSTARTRKAAQGSEPTTSPAPPPAPALSLPMNTGRAGLSSYLCKIGRMSV